MIPVSDQLCYCQANFKLVLEARRQNTILNIINQFYDTQVWQMKLEPEDARDDLDIRNIASFNQTRKLSDRTESLTKLQ